MRAGVPQGHAQARRLVAWAAARDLGVDEDSEVLGQRELSALMAFSTEDDNTVRLWQLPSGNALATLHNDGSCARSSRAMLPYPQESGVGRKPQDASPKGSRWKQRRARWSLPRPGWSRSAESRG